jgi:hypothetical protein
MISQFFARSSFSTIAVVTPRTRIATTISSDAPKPNARTVAITTTPKNREGEANVGNEAKELLQKCGAVVVHRLAYRNSFMA